MFIRKILNSICVMQIKEFVKSKKSCVDTCMLILDRVPTKEELSICILSKGKSKYCEKVL